MFDLKLDFVGDFNIPPTRVELTGTYAKGRFALRYYHGEKLRAIVLCHQSPNEVQSAKTELRRPRQIEAFRLLDAIDLPRADQICVASSRKSFIQAQLFMLRVKLKTRAIVPANDPGPIVGVRAAFRFRSQSCFSIRDGRVSSTDDPPPGLVPGSSARIAPATSFIVEK